MLVLDKTRRDFIKLCSTGTAGFALASLLNCAKREERPNILWLISEDTSPDMGCYGATVVQTPNFDRLAAEGVRFTRAFSTNPVCSPSRSAFMTGMYQTSIGAHQHRTEPKELLPEPVRIIPEYFRDEGYFITNCRGLDWDVEGKTDWNFEVSGEPFDGTDWSERKPDQPFFAQVNLPLTHRVFERDRENPIDPSAVDIPPYYPDHPVARRDWADYLESIQILDRQIGAVLKRLDDEGLADNTIVFYFGDHGRPHVRGKQWLYEGGIHIPLIVRWTGQLEPGTVVDDLVSSIDFGPTCMALSGIQPPDYMQGQVFLGENAEKRDYIFAARDRCDMTIDRIRCVRTKRFKYIHNFYPDRPYTQFSRYKDFFYPVLTLMKVLYKQGKLTPEQSRFMAPNRPEDELYDIENDPFELKNLAEDTQYSQILGDLKNRLNTWIRETGDQGGVPEDSDGLAIRAEARKKRYEGLWKERGLSPDITPEQYLEFWKKELGIGE